MGAVRLLLRPRVGRALDGVDLSIRAGGRREGAGPSSARLGWAGQVLGGHPCPLGSLWLAPPELLKGRGTGDQEAHCSSGDQDPQTPFRAAGVTRRAAQVGRGPQQMRGLTAKPVCPSRTQVGSVPKGLCGQRQGGISLTSPHAPQCCAVSTEAPVRTMCGQWGGPG